jgi:biopolymer transport protein TolQ
MNALLSIGAKGTAAIAVVAPGIAEALSTTIAGLLVGIPALIFFNIFLFQNRRIEAVLNHYASELMSRFKRGDLVPPSSYAHGKAGKGADSAGYPLSA